MVVEASLEHKKLRKRRRNRMLILLSPILLPLSPVLLPIYYLIKKRKRAASSNNFPRLGELAGSLTDVEPGLIDKTNEARIDALPDNFALCRIIGNDLVPRHRAGQSFENVKFVLENEPELQNCTKVWLLNRIFDPETEARIIELLEEHAQIYERIPFILEEFLAVGYDFATFDDPLIFVDGRLERLGENGQTFKGGPIRAVVQAYRARNNYVMNNNGARNIALELCLRHAKWALPFDGNCFFTQEAWKAFHSDILAQREKRYFTVAMARIQDNSALLNTGYLPEAKEEPQMAFRCDAPLRFDPSHAYGRRPKVEMFLHLGIPGEWTRWFQDPFDASPRKVSAEGYRVGKAGWVARLFSGEAKLEAAGKQVMRNRGQARAEAIRSTIDMLEKSAVLPNLSSGEPLCYELLLAETPGTADREAIIAAAEVALERSPHSVADKSQPGPSGNILDYYHPAPYWWPDQSKPDGLPYIRRDGERVPGTQMYSPDSSRFDRTRLQQFFDDTTALALASRVTGNKAYREHAERLIQTWFIDPETRMNPHLKYAQVRLGHYGNKGMSHGIIETKDFYYFLDAVRLVGNPNITQGVQKWSEQFFVWLCKSEQGRKECQASNNHGTCYDLQTAALAAFLGDTQSLQEISLRAQARLMGTITKKGEQPHEMQRTLTHHYCVFNLQSWINLFNLLEGAGMRPWASDSAERLITGIRRTLTESVEGWSHPQIEPFETKRLVPLDFALRRRTGDGILLEDTAHASFFPHDGIPPFWRLARGLSENA